MKLVVPLVLALLLLPLAQAQPDLRTPCQGTFCQVGPCLTGMSTMWPGYAFLLVCRDANGREFLFVADYTCDGGLNGVGLRVFGRGFDCFTPRSLFEQTIHLP